MLFHMIVHCVLILLSFLANVADKEPLGILLIYVGHTEWWVGGGFNFCKPNGCPCEATLSGVAKLRLQPKQPYAATVSRTVVRVRRL